MNFVPLFLPDVEQEYRNLRGGGYLGYTAMWNKIALNGSPFLR